MTAHATESTKMKASIHGQTSARSSAVCAADGGADGWLIAFTALSISETRAERGCVAPPACKIVRPPNHGPMVNLLKEPFWGHRDETFGSCPNHLLADS